MVSCNDSRNLLFYPKGYSEEKDKYLSLLLELDNWEYFLLNKKIYAEFNLWIRNEYHGHDQEITGEVFPSYVNLNTRSRVGLL